jgi:hypothetical protein
VNPWSAKSNGCGLIRNVWSESGYQAGSFKILLGS